MTKNWFMDPYILSPYCIRCKLVVSNKTREKSKKKSHIGQIILPQNV